MSDKKIVWILGAGFSRSLGAPLLSDLFSAAQLDRVLLRYRDKFREDALLAGRITALYAAGVWGVPGPEPIQRQWEHAEEFLERLDIARTSQPERERLTRFCEVAGERVRNLAKLAQEIRDGREFKTVQHAALRLVAAECSVFLKDQDVAYERWKPYIRWAKQIGNSGSNDTVVTFNYDCVPERLEQFGLTVVTPKKIEELRTQQPNWREDEGAIVLKLHGSVSWRRTANALIESANDQEFAISSAFEELTLAGPGPMKAQMIAESDGLRDLWRVARQALAQADVVVLLGYRMPPTDAYTREWLLKCLQERTHADTKTAPLRVYTVLGPDRDSTESLRLFGLLLRVSGGLIQAQRESMFAEDFLAVFDRDRL